MISAYRFIGQYEKVHKIPYDGEILYNILMKQHSTVVANNLVCETLDPTSLIAQLYSNNLLTSKTIITMNKKIVEEYKQNKKNKFKSILYKL